MFSCPDQCFADRAVQYVYAANRNNYHSDLGILFYLALRDLDIKITLVVLSQVQTHIKQKFNNSFTSMPGIIEGLFHQNINYGILILSHCR